MTEETKQLKGVILCTAFVYAFRPLTESHANESCVLPSLFGFGLYGFFLKDVRVFKPIPWKGQQGIFNIPDELFN